MICEKPRTTALAVGSTIAVLYLLCALALAFAFMDQSRMHFSAAKRLQSVQFEEPHHLELKMERVQLLII